MSQENNAQAIYRARCSTGGGTLTAYASTKSRAFDAVVETLDHTGEHEDPERFARMMGVQIDRIELDRPAEWG